MNTIQQYHHRKPQLLGQLKYDRYIYAICRCPKDLRYGLVVDRNELTEYEKKLVIVTFIVISVVRILQWALVKENNNKHRYVVNNIKEKSNRRLT